MRTATNGCRDRRGEAKMTADQLTNVLVTMTLVELMVVLAR